MFKKLFKRDRKVEEPKTPQKSEQEAFSTHRFVLDGRTTQDVLDEALRNTYRVTQLKNVKEKEGFAQDSTLPSGLVYNVQAQNNLDASIISWYGSQGYLPYQITAMIGQHWLVDKACTMPAEDAVRKGFEVTVNDGEKIAPEVLAEIEDLNKKFQLTKNMIEYVRFGRMFGIRICLFLVDSDDPDFYYKPFNPDGVTPGSYKGMCQIDPYWVVPELDSKAAWNPMDKNFYVPTWWQVNGESIHRSHFAIYVESEVADYLKPTYLWGGVSIPQKIAERVYCSERTANEAPLLAMTKRILLYKTDLENAVLNQQQLTNRLEWAVQMRNNYGYQMMDSTEEVQQLDTALADLDSVIMTQYQLVASIAGVPSTKLLGTTPKGFNATGDYEMTSYHETLESLQANHLTDFVDAHLVRLMRSEITPKFNTEEFKIKIKWEPLKSATAEELANVNKFNAETDLTLSQTGAISGEDIRQRLISDPDSGYNGIEMYDIPDEMPDEETSEEEQSGVPGQAPNAADPQSDKVPEDT